MGLFDKAKQVAAGMGADESVKGHVVYAQELHITAGRDLVINGMNPLGDRMSQLDDGRVIFNLSKPVFYKLDSIEFAGQQTHEESVTTGESHTDSNSKTKKHGHGLSGAVIGTMMMPGVGTIAGAVAGHGNGHSKTKGHSDTTNSSVTRNVTVEDDSQATIHLTDNSGEHFQLIVTARQADWQQMQSFKWEHTAVETDSKNTEQQPEVASQSIPSPATADPVEELKKYKGLLDAGIINQDDFDAKKKQLLGL
ncbi:SHOCT domain-containing protein [Lacticaseibacillus pantheris]|uniref:SHOCT domain-containing protein n=1 Tax=Lacticaseibacillus pantheris TaxID=171523 RepID=UPI002658CAAB|nr:SHOCT domain-containing protein [Lacticaseibacillus pantheris]WKF85993.1 SHOCT domain-containing protein [Lacticaseibacillus pantheris]